MQGVRPMKHLGPILLSLICLFVSSNSISGSSEAKYYEKIKSTTINDIERTILVNKLNSDTSFEALKYAGNLHYFGDEKILPNYEMALKKYEQAYEANQADSDVLLMLGMFYSYGIGCELNHTKGLMFTVASARMGNGDAHATLGYLLSNGIGIKSNCSSSRAYLLSSAKKCLKEMSSKDAMSVRKPSRLSILAGDEDAAKSQNDAIEYYEYSAKGGDPSANLLLAQLYYFGTEGSDPDYEKARVYFENSVQLGHDSAYSFLGQIYYRGEGVPVDFELAFQFFSKAADSNVPSALNGLGLMHWKGHVVEKNIDLAEIYFKRASDLKYPESFYNYAMILMEQPGLANVDKIFQNLLAAAKLGYVFANYEIAKRYLKSANSCKTSLQYLRLILDKGPSQKIMKEAHSLLIKGFEDQALSRYMFLAAQGYEIANYNAGFILEKSNDHKHFKRAAFFYSRSAVLGNQAARRKLGDYFYKSGDLVSASAHYLMAVKEENPDAEALFNLGYAYETGQGLVKDLWSAYDMYKASLSVSKSGRIAINMALLKLKIKIIALRLKNGEVLNLWKKKLQGGVKSRHKSDKTLSMVLTLVLTTILYFYINYYHPRRNVIQRQPNQGNNHRQIQQYPETLNDSSESLADDAIKSPSVHSDSSQSEKSVEFRFRPSAESLNNRNEEDDQVD